MKKVPLVINDKPIRLEPGKYSSTVECTVKVIRGSDEVLHIRRIKAFDRFDVARCVSGLWHSIEVQDGWGEVTQL